MYEEEIHFRKLLPKQSETVLTRLTLVTVTFGPSDMFRIPSLLDVLTSKTYSIMSILFSEKGHY